MHAYWMRSKQFNSIEMSYSFRDAECSSANGFGEMISHLGSMESNPCICTSKSVLFVSCEFSHSPEILRVRNSVSETGLMYIMWSTALKGLILYPFKHFDLLYYNMYYIESILIYCAARVFQSAFPPSAEGRVHCVCGLLYDSVCCSRLRSDTHWPMENI